MKNVKIPLMIIALVAITGFAMISCIKSDEGGSASGAARVIGPETIVYVTKSGKSYHIEDCSSLRSSKIEITLGEAVSKGYEPCARCKAPVLDKGE